MSTSAAATTEPPAAFWRDPASYDYALQHNFIAPLKEAVQQRGHAPRALQLAVLQQLHWYFTVDLRERAPTVALTPSQAPVFHDRVRQIMQHIDAEALEALDPHQVSTEVRHALLSYQDPVLHSTVSLDAYDHDQGLMRLRYYVHGEPPSESFLVDGTATKPAYAKYRACRYYHRMLLRQRIVWLPVASATRLEVMLAGTAMSLVVGAQLFSSHSPTDLPQGLNATELLAVVRATYPPGKGGQQPLPTGWAGWKVRLLCALARLPWVRQKFANAWVFVDRNEEADDNAEHLYRWVRRHHPEINAWFLLNRSSSDWARLSAEGFRLVPEGVSRKLMMLNAAHVVSSQPEYSLGPFNRALYGDLMRWRFTYLRHGIQINDQSHWLNAQVFDRLVAISPEEFSAVVSDDTPYTFTEKEARLTGAPRHDQLLELSRLGSVSSADWIVIFPTWRGGFVDGRTKVLNAEDQIVHFASSKFAQRWSGLLNNAALRSMAERHGKRLVFMPHPNAAPYLNAFRIPAHVEVLTKADIRIQDLLCRTALMITDYSSIVFEMALLRRSVCYYQFDREEFFNGDHNWRQGYFDVDRDGFGPVAVTEKDLLQQIERVLLNGMPPGPEYLERMERALPNPDGMACQCVFDSILQLHQPYGE